MKPNSLIKPFRGVVLGRENDWNKSKKLGKSLFGVARWAYLIETSMLLRCQVIYLMPLRLPLAPGSLPRTRRLDSQSQELFSTTQNIIILVNSPVFCRYSAAIRRYVTANCQGPGGLAQASNLGNMFPNYRWWNLSPNGSRIDMTGLYFARTELLA